MSVSDPFAAALRLLTVRDRSEAELGERLRLKGHDEEAIASVLERCLRLGYLDDRRFARERARALLRQGRAVGRRLLDDLRRHGIAEGEARDAAAEAEDEFTREEVLAALAERRFPGFDYHQADDRQRQRVVNYFLRRGFALSQVLTFFKEERSRESP